MQLLTRFALAAGLAFGVSVESPALDAGGPPRNHSSARVNSQAATGGLRVGARSRTGSRLLHDHRRRNRQESSGQEGKLRAVAVVLAKQGQAKVAIVACDILMITREWLTQWPSKSSRRRHSRSTF